MHNPTDKGYIDTMMIQLPFYALRFHTISRTFFQFRQNDTNLVVHTLCFLNSVSSWCQTGLKYEASFKKELEMQVMWTSFDMVPNLKESALGTNVSRLYLG